MLFAAEGGGFFSSSASGYSKGLTLLLLGQKNEDSRHMRVSPWNHYQLVDQEPETDLQLASFKNRLFRGCTSFICFRRTSAGLDGQSPLKVGPAQEQSVLPSSLVSEKGNDHEIDVDDNDDSAKRFALKSSLKKQRVTVPVPTEDANGHDAVGPTDRRKVQWPDTCGIELAEVREFEPSEMGVSDDEFENGTGRRCMCAIM